MLREFNKMYLGIYALLKLNLERPIGIKPDILNLIESKIVNMNKKIENLKQFYDIEIETLKGKVMKFKNEQTIQEYLKMKSDAKDMLGHQNYQKIQILKIIKKSLK